jgi:hypothetical protein
MILDYADASLEVLKIPMNGWLELHGSPVLLTFVALPLATSAALLALPVNSGSDALPLDRCREVRLAPVVSPLNASFRIICCISRSTRWRMDLTSETT